jgi:hypothetical protein
MRLRPAVLALGALLLLTAAGCATPPPAPPPAANAQTDIIAQYGETMISKISQDQMVQQILAANHVTQELGVGLIVDPNGYVEKGFMAKSVQNQAAEQALLQHLINVNFGPFSAGMPQRKLVFLVPIKPQQMAAAPANGAVYQVDHLVLYQPNNVLVARLCDAHGLAFYAQQVSASMTALLNSEPAGPGADAALVIGVKPTGAVRAWLMDPDNALSADLQARMIAAAEAVPPVKPQGGPIVFAIAFKAWGGSGPMPAALATPMPDAWHYAGGGPVEVPDGLFAKIWP